MEYEEIKIQVPWGHIAGKAWGNNTNELVLAIHGWIDNANSFDPLIPLLPQCYYYISIDLPGHGKSSPLKSIVVRDYDYLITLKLIYNYFKRNKIIIMAHSSSGPIALTFTQYYPHFVNKIITFDNIYFFIKPADIIFEKYQSYYCNRINSLENKSRNVQSSNFSKEEIIKKMMCNRKVPLARKTAEILIERSIEETENGKYKITTAQNARQMIFTFYNANEVAAIVNKFPVTCPHLVILSTKSYHMKFAYRKVLEEFHKNSNFEFHIVEGTHEVHMENIKKVANIVTNFLTKHNNKL